MNTREYKERFYRDPECKTFEDLLNKVAHLMALKDQRIEQLEYDLNQQVNRDHQGSDMRTNQSWIKDYKLTNFGLIRIQAQLGTIDSKNWL
jgi:hypothetical protein